MTPHPLVTHLLAVASEQGISVGTLARRTGYASTTLKNWQTGRTSPDVDRLEDLANLLGLRIALVPADDNPAPTEGTR